MSQLYRICISGWGTGTNPYPRGLQNENFVTNIKPYCDGPLGDICETGMAILFDGSFNYSIIQGDSHGVLCQDSLHDNTSDIMFIPSDFPTNDEFTDIYGVIGQSKLEFQSSYYYIDKVRNADVLNSVMSFKTSLWMLIIFFIFLFACLMKSKKSRTCPQYLRDLLHRLDQVFAHVMFENSMDDVRFTKILVITITGFSFIIHNYFNALIHTDLVVPVVPEVPYSYDDFASTAPLLFFPKLSSSLKYLKESPEGSPERRLYDTALRRNISIGSNITLQEPKWVDGSFISSWLYSYLYDLMNRHITISTEMYMIGSISTVCTAKVYSEAPELEELVNNLKTEFVPRFKNLYPWVTSDPDTIPILQAFIKRRDFIPDKKIWKRVKRSIEHGMYQKIILTAETLDLSQGLPFPVKKRSTAMRDCLQYSRKLKIKEVGFHDVKLINCKKLACAFLAFVSLCCWIFILEVFLKKRPTLVHPI